MPSTLKRAFRFVLEISFKVYHHGHKSWDAFALFVGLFSIHTFPTLPPPPPTPTSQTTLDVCIYNFFFRGSTLYRVGERELQESFDKDALFYEGTQK